MDGDDLAVLLDSERRGLEVYGPAGYRWAPRVGQRVLVLQGKGEIPCVVGVRQGEDDPQSVAIQAERVDLRGQVYVNGVALEEYIARQVAELGGA
jgi:hypothetical protein